MRWLALALAVVLGVAWIRVAASAREELAAARAAEAEGDLDRAIRRYQYALRWYSPGADAPRDAAEALWVIARGAHARGDADTALKALRALRGGALATRSLFSPFEHYLGPANRALARLTAEAHVGRPSAEGRSVDELEAYHARLLALDPVPAPGWSLLVVLGFVGWVAGGFATIFRGLDREARVRRGPFLRWGGLTALCFAAWVVGLIYA